MPLRASRRTEALVGRNLRRWRISLSALISLLIHVAIGVLLLVTIPREERSELLPPPAPVTMVFEGGRKSGPTLPQPDLQATPAAPAAPETPPAAEAPSAEPPPIAPGKPEPLEPSLPLPVPAPPVETPPAPAVPAPPPVPVPPPVQAPQIQQPRTQTPPPEVEPEPVPPPPPVEAATPTTVSPAGGRTVIADTTGPRAEGDTRRATAAETRYETVAEAVGLSGTDGPEFRQGAIRLPHSVALRFPAAFPGPDRYVAWPSCERNRRSHAVRR